MLTATKTLHGYMDVLKLKLPKVSTNDIKKSRTRLPSKQNSRS